MTEESSRTAVIELDFSFLSKVLTEQAIKIGAIEENHYLEINDVIVSEQEHEKIFFDVDIYEYKRN